jgi:DNA-binding beta-propeller fold protein YncE
MFHRVGCSIDEGYRVRSAHEAFCTPDGKEIWVTVRGENYVSVLDEG